MSDATLTSASSTHSGRPQFTIYNTNKEFLEWYKKNLGNISNDIHLYESGDEKHKRNVEYGFDSERNANYKDIYSLSTVSHPFNENLYQWYDSGSKIYPEGLDLTATIAKVWYAGDGNINWDGDKRAYCEIGCNNESNNKDKIISIFDSVGIGVTFSSGRIRFYGNSEHFLDWIGDPPTGMEYKWEINDRERYKEINQNT